MKAQLLEKSTPTNRSISQLLSRAGFKNAGVKANANCSYTVPGNAEGYGCGEMVSRHDYSSSHSWRSVEVSWYGEGEFPVEAMAKLLDSRGYVASEVNPRSLNTGRPSITVWFAGAEKE